MFKTNNRHITETQVHKIRDMFFISFIVFLALFAVGCTANTDAKVVSSEEGTKKATTATEAATTEEVLLERSEFFIGEYVNLKDIVVRVIGASDYAETNQFMQPDEGFVRKAVEVEVINIGDTNYSLSSIFSFEIRDSEGFSYTPNFFDGTNQVLSGTIPVAGRARGYVFFDIPKDETISQLLYDYALFSNGQITFDLDVTKAVTDTSYTIDEVLRTVKMGNEVVDTSLSITINSVKQKELSRFDATSNPGYSYLIADVIVKNTSSSNQYIYASSMFYAVDAEGFRYSLSVFAEGLRGNLDGDLAPGKETRAEIAFLVKKGVFIDYIVYSDTFSKGDLPVVLVEEVIN